MAVPVIAIDGPSASGKGTVARHVADALGFHFLDSGALHEFTFPLPQFELSQARQCVFFASSGIHQHTGSGRG